MKKLALLMIALLLSITLLMACDSSDGAQNESTDSEDTTTNVTETTESAESSDTSESEETTEAHTHVFGEWKTVDEVSCTENGLEKRECSCGEAESRIVEAQGHTEVDDAAVDASCEKTGLTAGKHCSACDAVIVPRTETIALGHKDENTDHVCDRCLKDGISEHVDTTPADHICDLCNQRIGELVDFTGEYALKDWDKGTEVYNRTVGGIKVSNKNATGGGVYGATTPYVIAGHVYEITYTVRCSSPTATRTQMRFIYGSITSKNAGDDKNDGYLGWILYKDNSGKIAQVATNNIQYDLAKVVDRDINAADNYAQDFKVIVNGITNTMTLYAVKNGAYVEVESMTFSLSKDTLLITTGAWDSFTGSNFVELSNVTVYEGCSDADKNHLCDHCSARISNCADTVDADHVCDLCGAAAVTECKDENKDHICDTDVLCDAHIEHKYASGACSVCEIAEHAEVDVKINATQADGSDDLCDICGVRMSRIIKLAQNKNKVKIYGRSAETVDGIASDFSASGIEFNVRITGGDVKITVNSVETSYYTLYINGERQDKRLIFVNGTAEYVIAEDLAAGDYTFKIIKQTQVTHSLSTLISLSMNGQLLDPPENKEILIEFAGDSITCGYSLIGYPTDGVDNYRGAEYMDASQSYAYLAAQLLDADHSMVAASGWAVIPNDNGSGSIPGIYGKTSYRRSDEEYAPTRAADIVVIHLGTNDLASRESYSTEFVAMAKEFIKDIQAKNPGAKIVWAYGSMMGGSNLSTFKGMVNTIVSDLGGARAGVYSVQLPTDTTGGHNHPSVDGHIESAQILASFIAANCLD